MEIKNKNKISIILGLIIVIVILYFTVNNLRTNNTLAQAFDFPLQATEIEDVLIEHEIDWHITDNSVVDESRNIFTLRNDKKITMGIDAYVREGYKVLSMTWFLPSSLTSDEVNNFFKSDLKNHLELSGIFYGNKKGLDKALSEMLNYYLDENNYNKKLDWNKRVENDHIKVQIKPMHSNSGNQIITLLIMPSELYEDYLRQR